MLITALCFLLGVVSVTWAEPSLSPSIEADADFLLTTTDFAQAEFGMAVEAVEATPTRVTVRTTGAEFVFEPRAGLLHLRQRLGKAREAAVVNLGPGALTGLAVDRRGTGAVLLTANGGRLRLRINGDSLLMLKTEAPLAVSYRLGFYPASLRQFAASYLSLDEYGGVGSTLVAGPGEAVSSRDDLVITHDLKAGQVLWFSVAPPKPYDWEASLRDRVVWHWSRETGYPSDAEIEAWSKYGNLLLQQSEVMLWKDWSLRFIPRNGTEEFQRVNNTCRRFGMRNYVYTSPFYFLTGTGLETKAMNSFDHFDETGFSPGDDRGLNWPIFLGEITKVMREYRPQGLYFDGIYGNVVRTYLITRRAREVVGEGGLLEYHATWSPPGGGVYLPQIDTYYNFVLRGEGAQNLYQDDDYLRYFVSTHNISNSIGVLCDNNDYHLDPAFIAKLLDYNLRLHLIPGWLSDYRKEVMTNDYWPRLTASLRPRVEDLCAQRAKSAERDWAILREAEKQGTEGLTLALAEDFRNPALKAAAPAPPADHQAQTSPPGQPAYLSLPHGWRAYFSANNDGALVAEDGALKITGRGNTCAYLERPLPDDVAAVQCKIRCGDGGGMSWGPGLMLQSPAGRCRINVRQEGRLGLDRGGGQTLMEGYPVGVWYWVRLRLAGHFVIYEVSRDGSQWRCLAAENAGLSGPKRLVVGKIADAGTNTEYVETGGPGTSWVAEVKVYTRPGPG
jgi:hypothetical protein